MNTPCRGRKIAVVISLPRHKRKCGGCNRREEITCVISPREPQRTLQQGGKNAAYCIEHINVHRESDRIFSDPVCLVVFPSPEGSGIFQLDRILQTEAEKQVAGADHLCGDLLVFL